MRRLVVLVSFALAGLVSLPAPAAPLDVVDRSFLCQSGRVGALPGFYVQAIAQTTWTDGHVSLLGQLYGPNSLRVTAARGKAAVTWAPRRCRAASTKVPLGQGPLRTAYRDTAKCVLGGAILVRVRAVRQGGKLVETHMAVAMQNKRRAMAYAVALRNGDARLYTRPACDL